MHAYLHTYTCLYTVYNDISSSYVYLYGCHIRDIIHICIHGSVLVWFDGVFIPLHDASLANIQSARGLCSYVYGVPEKHGDAGDGKTQRKRGSQAVAMGAPSMSCEHFRVLRLRNQNTERKIGWVSRDGPITLCAVRVVLSCP